MAPIARTRMLLRTEAADHRIDVLLATGDPQPGRHLVGRPVAARPGGERPDPSWSESDGFDSVSPGADLAMRAVEPSENLKAGAHSRWMTCGAERYREASGATLGHAFGRARVQREQSAQQRAGLRPTALTRREQILDLLELLVDQHDECRSVDASRSAARARGGGRRGARRRRRGGSRQTR